jgi:hypothetical protein
MKKSRIDSDVEMKINDIIHDHHTSSSASASASSHTNHIHTHTHTHNSSNNDTEDGDGDADLLHSSWHVPYIAHFTWLFQKQLNMKAVSIVELESSLMSASTSTLLHQLLTRLLIGKVERSRLQRGETYNYAVICTLLRFQFAFWFMTLEEMPEVGIGSDDEKTSSSSTRSRNKSATDPDDYDISDHEAREESSYSSTVRHQFSYINPLANHSFDELSVDCK